jgi:hypothetical protein
MGSSQWLWGISRDQHKRGVNIQYKEHWLTQHNDCAMQQTAIPWTSNFMEQPPMPPKKRTPRIRLSARMTCLFYFAERQEGFSPYHEGIIGLRAKRKMKERRLQYRSVPQSPGGYERIREEGTRDVDVTRTRVLTCNHGNHNSFRKLKPM